MNSEQVNHRLALQKALPRAAQPFIDWLSGIPCNENRTLILLTPKAVVLLAVSSILIGFGFIALSLITNWLLAIGFYFIGFCFVSGGMRRLDVLIIHQTLHNKVLSTPSKNRILGEFLSTILFRTPFLENRKEHMEHHKSPCDENDVDVLFLRQAGIACANSRRELYFSVLRAALSPSFHLSFVLRRLRGNFISAKPYSRLAMSWCYLIVLIAPATIIGRDYALVLTMFWLLPLTIGFQISNFLYTTTKHRWWLFDNKEVKDKDKKDLLSYARVCCSPLPDENSTYKWIKWWAESIFVHAPTRLFVVVGDTVQHDLHHVAPGCDWPNSDLERVKYEKKNPHRFTAVWGGYLAHLRECNLRERRGS